jgi:hypothetical protein
MTGICLGAGYEVLLELGDKPARIHALVSVQMAGYLQY